MVEVIEYVPPGKRYRDPRNVALFESDSIPSWAVLFRDLTYGVYHDTNLMPIRPDELKTKERERETV